MKRRVPPRSVCTFSAPPRPRSAEQLHVTQNAMRKLPICSQGNPAYALRMSIISTRTMFHTLLLAGALAATATADVSVPEQNAVVLHTEPPAQSPLARLVATTTRVEIRVAPDGTVSAAKALAPRPPFVASLAEEASCKWRFSPDSSDAERAYVLTFVFAGVGTTDEPSQWVVTREAPLTVRIQYLQSTVRRLDRDDEGHVALRSCPVHRTPMEIGLVPVAYGLPRSYSSDDPGDRVALRKARRVWSAHRRRFPEANLRAGGGGCVVQPEKVAEVHYCSHCRRVREEWFRRHPGYEQYE